MGEVVNLDNITKLDLDPDRVLNGALAKLESVVIVGFDKDGDEYFASSVADGGTALWLLERMKMKLLQVPDEL